MSALGARIEGARVLDLFAGSGALAIEALSRGAAHATLVERDRGAASVIERNLGACGFTDRSRLLRMDALRFLRDPGAAGPFDLVFLDPPYEKDVGERALAGLGAGGLLAAGATIVLEHAPGRAPDPAPPGLSRRRTAAYGDCCLSYLEAGS